MAAERIQSGAAGRTSGGVEDRAPEEPTERTALVAPEVDPAGERRVGRGAGKLLDRRKHRHAERGRDAAGKVVAAERRPAHRVVDVPRSEPRMFDVGHTILAHRQALLPIAPAPPVGARCDPAAAAAVSRECGIADAPTPSVFAWRRLANGPRLAPNGGRPPSRVAPAPR